MSENLRKLISSVSSTVENSFSPELDLQKILRSFTEKNNSPATRRTYAAHLKEFFSFARATNGAEALRITSDAVVNWREAMICKGNKPATVRTKLAAVRSFYEHLKHLGLIRNNPASVYLVPPPGTGDDPTGRALDSAQVRLLLELPRRETTRGAMDYALMLLMLRTFLRVSEAVSLRETDFFYRRNSWFLRVKIKGGEIKNVPVPIDVKKAIDDYHFLDRRHRSLIKWADKDGKFVFTPSMEKITRHDATANVHLTSRHVWHLVRGYGQKLFAGEMIKLKKENPSTGEQALQKAFRLTPHDFRRTAITRALDLGESYRRVMNASRHRSISSIQRYDLHRQSIEENSILSLHYDED
ncbi:MAG: tyrosine-type recombinase/integrase [Pyrinomonadaceae bacterium]